MEGIFYLILQGKDSLPWRWRRRAPPKRQQVFTKFKALHHYNVQGDHHTIGDHMHNIFYFYFSNVVTRNICSLQTQLTEQRPSGTWSRSRKIEPPPMGKQHLTSGKQKKLQLVQKWTIPHGALHCYSGHSRGRRGSVSTLCCAGHQRL